MARHDLQAAPRERGREATGQPPVRVNKHAARRAETRARLIKAARRLIAEGRFHACSTDDLAQLAGVSRAGFYLHFPNRQAVLEALQEEMGDWYIRQYRKLDPEIASTEEGLVQWLKNFVRGFAAAREPIIMLRDGGDLLGLGARRRGEAVLVLGGQVPAFRLVRDDGRIDEERRIGLLLLVFQVEQLCSHLVLEAPGEGDLPLRVLARQFLMFMGAPKARCEGPHG